MTRMKSSKLALILSIMLFCEMHDASAQRYRYQAAQRYNYDDEESIFFFGIGTGLDYGGLGVKIEGTPIPPVRRSLRRWLCAKAATSER